MSSRIIIEDEPICEYIKNNTIECNYDDLPKLRAAIFKLSLELDDVMKGRNLMEEAKVLFDQTLIAHFNIED